MIGRHNSSNLTNKVYLTNVFLFNPTACLNNLLGFDLTEIVEVNVGKFVLIDVIIHVARIYLPSQMFDCKDKPNKIWLEINILTLSENKGIRLSLKIVKIMDWLACWTFRYFLCWLGWIIIFLFDMFLDRCPKYFLSCIFWIRDICLLESHVEISLSACSVKIPEFWKVRMHITWICLFKCNAMWLNSAHKHNLPTKEKNKLLKRTKRKINVLAS